MEPTLIIMAAGLGSRYGGDKQIDALGPAGESMMEYSLFDAAQAGFGKVVFVIRQEMQAAVEEIVGKRVSRYMEVAYALQTHGSMLPQGFSAPEGRKKPWGTAHATLCAAPYVDGPFCVINADDYYGPATFAAMGAFLQQSPRSQKMEIAMAGFALENTLTENGSVSRGVCEVSEDGLLCSITERTEICQGEETPVYRDGNRWVPLAGNTVVSMNCWGFPSSFMQELKTGFWEFLPAMADPMKSEYYLPAAVDRLLQADRAVVKVLPTPEKWFGVTYQADRESVQAALRELDAKVPSPRTQWGK